MDARALREFLEHLKAKHLVQGLFRGFLHLLIGRRITGKDGKIFSMGLTWRDLAGWLKKVRWDTDYVAEVPLDPKELPPRDRERFWYTVIARAGVDTEQARVEAEKLAEKLRAQGYGVGPAPGEAQS